MRNTSFNEQVLKPFLLKTNEAAERNAFFINETYYTYKQLGDSISKIRMALKKLPSDIIYIGLVANDDIETYASIFATWLVLGEKIATENKVRFLNFLNDTTLINNSSYFADASHLNYEGADIFSNRLVDKITGNNTLSE